jgi:predicted DCC family thiol-disulfide oxidoreductase YuxK
VYVVTTASLAAELPKLASIEERPDADVVIFDGECNFCRAQVERLARWDGTGKRLAFLSLHDPRVAERYPDLTHDMLMAQMYVIDRQGRRHGGAAAFRYLTTRLPRLWLLAPLLHLPGTLPLWQWGYRLIAKNRYLFMGRQPTCENGACEIHFRSGGRT